MTKNILAVLIVVLSMAFMARADEAPDFTDAVNQIAVKLGGEDLYARGEAARMLEGLAVHASRPGAEAERASLCRAMFKALGPDTPRWGRVWLLRQIEKSGRAEVVDTLAGLLLDPDDLIRQHAVMALAANPSDEAGAKLREALAGSDDSYARVAIINAVGYRRDARAISNLAKWMDDSDERVSGAAVAALGSIGNAEALATLDKKVAPTPAGVDAYLRCLDALAKENPERSVEVYSNLFHTADARQQKLAGLHGVAMGKEREKAVPLLLEALTTKDTQMQLAAAQLAVLAGPAVGEKVLESFDSLPAVSQAALLVACGERGIPGVKEKALTATKSSDSSVRAAAYEALGSVGDTATALMLAKVAATKGGAEKSAARESIAKIRGIEVDAAMLAELPKADAKVKAELVRGLAARRSMGAISILETTAAADPDAAVRVEAINALGRIGQPESLGPLLKILLNARDENQLQAAEAAIASIQSRVENPDARAAFLLNPLAEATGSQRMAILRLLGRTGSSRALEALRRELKEGSPQMHDATVRALSEWPDAKVIPDLIAIAREDPSQTNKVLALRGYVRVVALPSERKPVETARMLGNALEIAPANEKKAILGALGAVGDVQALHLATPLMDDEEVRNEAITATLRIARAVAGVVPDEATAAANHALELSQDEAVKRNVAAVVLAAERSRDFITNWLVAGPYKEEGKEKDALFDFEFPPEKGEDARWVQMPANPDRTRFWEMNFDAVSDLRGNNRAAYLRTRVFVPSGQELQLEVGSDDAIKVWVNQKLVHSNNASRGNEPGQDKVKIRLDEGWNTLLMKVINGGGGWGANARLRTLDDKKVEGMKVKAE